MAVRRGAQIRFRLIDVVPEVSGRKGGTAPYAYFIGLFRSLHDVEHVVVFFAHVEYQLVALCVAGGYDRVDVFLVHPDGF